MDSIKELFKIAMDLPAPTPWDLKAAKKFKEKIKLL